MVNLNQSQNYITDVNLGNKRKYDNIKLNL